MLTRAVDLKSAAIQDLDVSAPFKEPMNGIGLSSQDTGGKITFVGTDPIFESRFRIGTCISIPIMAAAAGAAIVWRMRTGRSQDLSIDLRKAIHGVNPVVFPMARQRNVKFVIGSSLNAGFRSGSPRYNYGKTS